MKKTAITFVFIVLVISVKAQTYQPTWESIDSRPIPDWFQDAKFGIFIHWGIYSVPAYSPTVRDSVVWWNRYAEWYWKRWKDKNDVQKYFVDFHNRVYGKDKTYHDFANEFKAELFNPDDWAQRFKDAGAKYVVLTTKHHDGFALWPTKYSWNWNSAEVGAQRDLLGSLSKSVREKGLHMGCYYSLMEWYNPDFNKQNINKYVDDHLIPQMKELISAYNPDVLWTDGDGGFNSQELKSTQFLAWLFNESAVKANIVVNDRWGTDANGKHGGFFTTEYDNADNKDLLNNKLSHPWEECRGIAGSFGYNRNENLEDYSTSEELIHILIDKVARGGNLLLNIGPTADGRIPEIQQQRLADMGVWLKVNGESIYETRKWEGAPAIAHKPTVYFTKNGNNLYVIVTKWEDKPFVVEGIGKAESVSMLGFTGKVKYSISGSQLTITPPAVSPATNPCNYAWVFKITNALK